MSRLRTITILLVILLVLPIAIFAQRETVDKIVAVVGNEVITASELAGQVQMYIFQTKEQPKNEEELVELHRKILEDMISDKLFLLEAREDTTINIRPEEIDQALEEHVARLAKNFDSNDAFLRALADEGMDLRTLKKQYRPEIENQLLKQRLIQKRLSSVSISRHEVEEFFKNHEDSLPRQPEAVQLAHILLTIKPSSEVEDSVKEEAAKLRQMVLDGADFAAISAQYSSMGAGANGGDLGYVSSDEVVPEFARAAFSLNPGDISGVIRTQFGYHVIKCEGQKGDRLKLRHILLAVQPTQEDTARTVQLADSLLQLFRSGEADFAEMAKVYSEDNESRINGGELGWFAVDQLPPEFEAAMADWKEPGTYRGPVFSRFGLHILKLLNYTPEKIYTLKDDYDRIKELARQEKTAKLIDNWILEIKDKTYIDLRLGDDATG